MVMVEELGGVSVHLLGAVPLDIIILDLAAVIDEALGQRWTIWAQRPRWWNRGHRTERSAGKKRAWPRPSTGAEEGTENSSGGCCRAAYCIARNARIGVEVTCVGVAAYA